MAHVKNILVNSAVTLFASGLALILVEGALRIDGRYDHLASQELVRSPAIWERPASRVEFDRHPDLHVPIEVHFDADGVRNHLGPTTSEKRNIVAFFGDSFTENRRIEDRFSFTAILDSAMRPHARVANYGVDSYGLDQSYLRYKKYEKQDIRHVVYVFCRNDLQDLYKTGLTEITPDGNVVFKTARINFARHLIGRLHTTYLVLSAYYDLTRHIRMYGRADDAITADFLSATPSEDVSLLAKKFVLLLNKWKRGVESAGRTFTVLVLPRQIDADVAAKLLHGFDGKAVQSLVYFKECNNCTFRNDAHWNEHGNLRMAEFILSDATFPFHESVASTNLPGARDQIEQYYRAATN